MNKKTQKKKGKNASLIARDKRGRMSAVSKRVSSVSALSQKSSKKDPFKEFDIRNRKFSKPKRIDFFKGRSR